MEQITQKELLKVMEEKQALAEWDRKQKHETPGDYCVLYGEIRAYEDVIKYLNSVEIVLDTLCPTCKDFATCYHRQKSEKNAIK